MTLSTDLEWLKKEKYAGVENEDFLADVKRLESGEPLAYIIGNIPFLNTTIYLDSHPLIPRPETEYWTEQAIKVIETKTKSLSNPAKILDLCAGSGCIGVAVGHNIKQTTIDFLEIDPTHLTTINKNCQLNQINQNRYRVIIGDLLNLEQSISGNKYDFILSNPPYIDQSLGRTAESVKEFEPAIALYGGVKGLNLISSIIKQAPDYLPTDGQLWLEHEPEQVAAIADLASRSGFIIHTHQDQFGVRRFSQLMLQ